MGPYFSALDGNCPESKNDAENGENVEDHHRQDILKVLDGFQSGCHGCFDEIESAF